MLQYVTTYDAAARKQFVADVFPLPTRTVPTVREVKHRGWWYRIVRGHPLDGLNVFHYMTRDDAERDLGGVCGWFPEDQPTVAALLLLPLTEEVEDTGEGEAR